LAEDVDQATIDQYLALAGADGYLEFLSIVENAADTAEKREMMEWAASME